MEEERVCMIEGGRRLTRLRVSKEEDVHKTTSKPSIEMRWREEVKTSYDTG